MTEVQGVEGTDSSFIDWSGLEESVKPAKETGSPTYQDSGVNGGFIRLQEEGAFLEATSPEIRLAHLKGALVQKLNDLSPLMKHEEQGALDSNVIPIIIEKVAPIDVNLALFYSDRLKYENRIQAQITISKYLSDSQAQLIFDDLKDRFGYFDNILVLICREELLRGLSGAKKTLECIKTYKDPYYVYEIVKLFKEFEVEVPCGLVEKYREGIMQFLQGHPDVPELHRIGLLRLLKTEALVESPLALDTLDKLRGNALQVRQSYLERHPDKPEHAACDYVGSLMGIIQAEAQTPFLSSALEEDLKFVLDTVRKFKSLYPDEAEYFDFKISYGIEKLITYYPTHALQILESIEDHDRHIGALIELIKAGSPHQERLLQELIEGVACVEGDPQDHLHHNISLFYAAMQVKGLDEALPYYEKARSYLDLLDDDIALEYVLEPLLILEAAYHFPAASKTLEKIYQTARCDDAFTFNIVPNIIKAELTLLIDSFQK